MANKKPHDNALKHGLTASRHVIPQLGETLETWETFRDGWHVALKPQNAPQREIADRIAGIVWRLRRAERYQLNRAVLWELPGDSDSFMSGLADMLGSDVKLTPELAQLKDGLKLAQSLIHSDSTDKARRYEISLERSLERNLKLYRTIQGMTQTGPDNTG